MRRILLAASFALTACSTQSNRSPSGGSNGGPCPEGTGCSAPGGDTGLCCRGSCIDITSDPQNCGGCGFPCPSGTSCQGGTCVIGNCSGAASTLSCIESDGASIGYCCGGGCVDPSDFQSDPLNCGGCGTGCALGSTCQNGSCVLPDGGVGFCESDSDCGAGQSCTTYGSCSPASCAGAAAGATCTLPATATDGTGICCSASCIDPSWDDANCGGCGIACSGGQQCLYGSCVQAVACSGANPGALCLFSTGVAGTCCGATCVNTEGDSQNCGGCAAACPIGSSCLFGGCYLADGGAAYCSPPSTGCPAGTLCGNGACEPATCGSGTAFCFLGVESYAGLCCGGNCVDVTSDPANCGACGSTCASSVCTPNAPPESYSNAPGLGLCLPPSASGNCSGVGGCPSGEVCVDDVCLEESCQDLETYLCATPSGTAGACCNDPALGPFCADVANDPSNCGGCDIICPTGQTCSNGVCSGSVAPCLAGHVYDGCELSTGPYGVCCPGGGCSDPLSDAANCGSCGNACGVGQTCVNGLCQ